ncbi:MAG: TonB-dependent receptor plug domain-containing protein [Gelidibacter sp.]
MRILALSILMFMSQKGFSQERNKQEPIKTDLDTVYLSKILIQNEDFRKQVLHVDLKNNPVNTAQDLLRKVPGLFIAQHAGGGKAEQIFLRGFDNDHGTDVSVTADGIPVNMVSHAHGQGYADLHFLIPETIKDIDFGKGAYYADKGDFNTSGYVNFTTFDKLKNNLVKLEGGSFNSMRAVTMINLLNRDVEDKNFYVASEFSYSDGPFDIKQNFNRVNIMAKYSKWIDNKQYLSILGSTFSSGWNASGQIPERAVKEGLISRWGSIDPTEGGSTSRSNFAINYRNIRNDDEEISSNLFYSKYDFNLFSNFTFFLNDLVYGDEIEQTDNRSIYGFDNKYIRRFDLENSSNPK